MNAEEIAGCLSPWIQVDTWYTSHPADTKRFNNAVAVAVAVVVGKVGLSWGYQEFKEAINLCLEKHHSTQTESDHFEEIIDRYAGNAEVIQTYLQDNMVR